MAQMSEDGRWYWDGHNWHPVPQAQPSALDAEPSVDEAEADAEVGQPERVSVRPDDVQVDGRDVDFGVGLIVDNAALSLVNAPRDTAYGLTLVLALLAGFGPNVIDTLTALRRSGRLDAMTGLESAFTTVLDTARTEPLSVAVVLVVALVVVATLRSVVHIRLGSAPWLQAVAGVEVGYVAGEFAAPYL